MTFTDPTAKQRASMRHADARINVWEGAVRSAKTVSSLIEWLHFVGTGPAGALVMVGRTERTLKRNIIDVLVDWLGPQRCHHNRGEGELWVCGRRIYLVGANDERAAEKIRGMTLAGAYVDEVSILPESMWKMLLSRLSIEGARLLGTTNPDNPSHWLMRDYLSHPSLWIQGDGTITRNVEGMDLHRFSFRLGDNPSLPATYVAALKREYTGLWRRRYIDGEWSIAEGAIYDMFDPDRHVTSTLPTDDRGRTDLDHWIVAADYGTLNPFHALLLAVNEDRRGIWVVDEYRHDGRGTGRQLTDAEYSTALRAWLDSVDPRMVDRLEGIYIDPSASSFITQLHRDDWLRVRHADNTVADGIRDVATLLGAGQLRFHEVPGLVAELPGYVWDPKAAARGEDKPVKVNDHGCLVAGTTVLTDRGERPIETVRRGQRVWTSVGWCKVLAGRRTQVDARVLRVGLSNGRSLTATPDHPVWVRHAGWTRVDALRYGDRLAGWTASRSLTKGSCSGATPSRPGGLTGSTSRRAKRIVSVACAAFTKNSGSPRTGRSRRAATSTTLTSTHSTTTWKIWHASLRLSTPKRTASAPQNAAGHRSTWRGSTRFDRWPQSGIAAMRGALGIVNTAARPGRNDSPSPASAISAGPASRPSNLMTRRGSAPANARPSGVGTRALMTSNSSVNAAARRSSPTAMTSAGSADVRVLSVTEVGRADVYNLKVEGRPEFFANGVLVHNCDALRYGVRALRRYWRHWVEAA